MKNKPNNYDYALSLFRSTDKLRPAMTKVFKQDKFYLATDSHTLIVIDSELTGLDYLEDEKAPNALALFDKISTNKEITFDRNEFLSKMISIEFEWENQYQECDKCKGQGIDTCPCCGNNNDCEECYGTGESETIIPFSYPRLTSDSLIELGDTTFNPNYLNRVLQVAFVLDEKNIIFKYPENEKYKAVLFEIGKVKIIVMPKVK